MAITVVDNPKRYAGTGSTTTYATPPYLDVGDLVVYLRKSDGSTVDWVYGTHYDLSGEGGTGDGLLTVLTDPTDYTPQTGEYLFIWLAVEATQGESFPNVTASIRSPIIRQLDRMALMIQDLQAQIDQALRVGRTDLATISGTMLLALETLRAGKLLSFDSSGNPALIDPGDLGDITAGDTLPIDAATAVVHKTGDTSSTLRFVLDALTAGRTITMPDADVDLGKLLSAATAFVSGDVGKMVAVSAAGRAVTTAYPVGHFVPGVTTRGDAAYSIVHGTTAQLIRFTTDLTAARTLTIAATGAWGGLFYLVDRADAGLFPLTVSGFGDSDDSTAELLPGETGLLMFDGSHWRFIGPWFRDRAIDLRGGVFRGYTAKRVSITGDTSLNTLDHSGCRITATNAATSVVTCTGGTAPATTLIDGFECTIIFKGSNPLNFTAAGGLTLRDPDGINGMTLAYGAASLFRDGDDLVLSGRTS